MQRRLRTCGVLVLAGLSAEVASLVWAHPTAFLFFIIVGGALMGVGILFFLYSLVSTEEAKAG